MRNLALFMHVSLDGYVTDPKGSMDWVIVSQEMFDYAGKRTAVADTALYGRVTYQMMDAYWPTAGDAPDADKHAVEHSRWYNKVQKVVLSRTMKGSDKPNTKFISDNAVEEVAKLKQAKGQEIVMFGSPGASHALTAASLIDDYWLFVNPILVGKGIPLFKDAPVRTKLALVENQTLPQGVVCLHYQLKRGK